MSSTLTLFGSYLVRIAYVILFIVFAMVPAVSAAFGDTGADRQVVNRDADGAILSSAARTVSDVSVSDESIPHSAFSHEGTLHPGASSISDRPCSKVVVPHGLAPDRPDASVPETTNPNISHQNILAPEVAAPITPESDDLVTNGLAPPDHASPSTPGGSANSAAAPLSQGNFIAGFLTVPHTTASTRGTLNSNSPHEAGDFDFKLLCSGTAAASDEAVAS